MRRELPHSLRILSLGEEVRDLVLEEESVTISEPIHIVAFDKANSEPLQDIVIEFLTLENLVVHE